MKKNSNQTKIKIEFITTAQLIELAGLGERRLRQLAAEGRLPRPKRGKWEYPAVVSRLIAHFKELSENTPYTEAKTQREQARARIANTEADMAEKKVVLVETVKREIFKNVIGCKMKIYQAEQTIQVEAGMKLSLTPEQQVKLREIIRAHHHRALLELHQGEFGVIECPECHKEIKQ
jgi:hypothetical protein